MKWRQTAEKEQTAIFICVVYPGDSLYQTLLVPERFKIVLLPFSNPQLICMPAMYILSEIHVCVLRFLKAIVKVHHKLSGHNPQSENFNARMKSRWFWWPSLLYSRRFFSFKCNSRDSTVAARKREKCQPVWSTSTSNVASDLTAKSLHSVWLTWEQVKVQFPCEVQTLPCFGCKLTSSAEFFGTVLSGLRMRPADNPRKYVIYFNSLYKSTSLAE